MKEGPNVAAVAALLGDPARANMLTALMDGRALTATELAQEAGVTVQTTSGHLARLEAAQLLRMEKQGRHRYFRLSGADVAEVLEGLMGLAARTGHLRSQLGPKDPALRQARICYDHLAGDMGVWAFDRLRAKGLVAGDDRHLHVTEPGEHFFGGLAQKCFRDIHVGVEENLHEPWRTCSTARSMAAWSMPFSRANRRASSASRRHSASACCARWSSSSKRSSAGKR